MEDHADPGVMFRKGIVNQVKRNARSPGSGIITKVDTSEPAVWAGARLNHSKLNLIESSHWPDAVKTRGMQRAAWRSPKRGGREGLPIKTIALVGCLDAAPRPRYCLWPARQHDLGSEQGCMGCRVYRYARTAPAKTSLDIPV